MELLRRKEENSLISVSMCLCGCITVYMNCGIKNLAEISHMFVQSGQGGCACRWILYKQIEISVARWLKVWYHRQLCASSCGWLLQMICLCLKKEL